MTTPLDAAVSARASDAREAIALRERQRAEQRLSPVEVRGVVATVRAVLKPLLKLVGVRLP